MNKGINSLVDNVSFQSSFNLLGKNVLVTDEAAGKDVTGSVESVTKRANEVYVTVNGQSYPLAGVLRVDD